MHSGNIENYNFIHGLHRNLINGKWFPLHPHDLARALTHDEMDYNLLYSQQTVAGWRIMGQNLDLTISDNELQKSLIFWKISATDLDYDRYVAAGYTVGQYVWITPLFDCDDFDIITQTVTEAEQDPCQYFAISSQSFTNTTDACDNFILAQEGVTESIWYIAPIPTFNGGGAGSGSGSGGGSGITPTATPFIGGGGGQSGLAPTATPIVDSSGSGSGGGSGIVPTPTYAPTATPFIGGGGGQSGLAPTPTDTPVFSNIPTPTPQSGGGGIIGGGQSNY